MWPNYSLDSLDMKPKEKKSIRFNNKGQVVYDRKKERILGYTGTLV